MVSVFVVFELFLLAATLLVVRLAEFSSFE
jgi:hypothetical protein